MKRRRLSNHSDRNVSRKTNRSRMKQWKWSTSPPASSLRRAHNEKDNTQETFNWVALQSKIARLCLQSAWRVRICFLTSMVSSSISGFAGLDLESFSILRRSCWSVKTTYSLWMLLSGRNRFLGRFNEALLQ